jgi:hypothetical protein
VVAFVLCGVAGLSILMASGRWQFRPSPERVIAEVEDTGPRLGAVQRGSRRWRWWPRWSPGFSIWRGSAKETRGG